MSGNLYPNNDPHLQAEIDALQSSKEDKSNKAVDFSTISNALYPSVEAVEDRIAASSSSIAPYFFYSNASDIATYLQMMQTPSSGGSQSTVVNNVTNGQTIVTFATNPNYPNKTYLSTGWNRVHIHAKKSSNGAATLYAEIYKRTTSGTETLLLTTTETEALTNTSSPYTIEVLNSAIQTMNSTDRIVVKIKATVTSGTPDITVYYEDAYLSRVDLSTSQSINGSPSALYAMTGTLAAIEAALPPASTPVDTLVSCSNLSAISNVMLKNNGTLWTIMGGRSIILKSSIATGIAPSGTIGTGSSGNITLGTALSRIYDQGCYLELPAIATTPAITAGKYWCVMSSTTVGTVYSSKGGSPINFTAGAAFTGVTTEVDLVPIPLPGYALGLDGGLTITYGQAHNSGAGAKTTRLRLDGTQALNLSGTTSVSLQNRFIWQNVGSYTKQKAFSGGVFPYAASAAAFATTDIDTSAAFTPKITGQHGSNATDTYMLEWYEVELCRW